MIQINGNNNQENWKADAAINVRVPREDGTKSKIGTLFLKMNKNVEKDIIEFLRENPNDGMDRLKEVMLFDFQEMGEQKLSKLAI